MQIEILTEVNRNIQGCLRQQKYKLKNDRDTKRENSKKKQNEGSSK